MTVKAFAKKFDISEDEMWDALKEAGYLKNDYSPKTKFINDELFDEDGNIVDFKTLMSEMTDYFGSEDEDEDDEDEEFDESEEEEDEGDEEEEEDEEEVDGSVDSIKEAIESLDKSELIELLKFIADELADYNDEESEEDDEDEEEDDEEEEDEEEETPKSKKKASKKSSKDPNAEGKYRGWTITKKGISVTATKGKKTLTTSIRGDIRAKIDDEED